jgi:ribonuclease P protein component
VGGTSAAPPPRKRFSSADRLHRGADFLHRLRAGRRQTDACFSLHYASTSLTRARLGLAVGRRVSPKATRRNRIKRTLREVFRHERATLPAFDLVVVVKPPAAALTRRELRRRFSAALRRAARGLT